jgi:hypothetical protein
MDIDNSAYNRERPNIAVLRFWIEYEDVAGKPGEPREVHMVEWVKKGTNGATTCEKVARSFKDGAMKDIIEPAYKSWLKGQEEPTDGTPLSAWPGVNPAQADRLKALHLRTVEDVAGMNDADMNRVGMGALALRDKARAFVAAKKDTAPLAEAMAKKDAEIAELRAQLAEVTDTMDKLAAANNMPRRGRPPKAEAA